MHKLRYTVLISILFVVQVVMNQASGEEGWNPYAPQGEKELSILRPSISIPIADNAPDFVLIIKAVLPKPDWEIQLEWARIEPARDPSIEKDGHWLMNTPINARAMIPWDEPSWAQQQTRISIVGFTPGMYAVRVKLRSRPDNTWTDWKKFWIGNPSFDLGRRQAGYAVIGQDRQPSQAAGDKTPTNGGTSAKIKPIGTQAMKIRPAEMQTLQGQAPVGVGAALGGGQTPGAMMKIQPKPVLPGTPAQSAAEPAPTLKPGAAKELIKAPALIRQ